MPRKRKQSLLKNEKQCLITRLIQISLEVDRYIYNGTYISIEQAQRYVNELAELKSKQCQDARTLQVIEKLTRQMKGIITEQNTSLTIASPQRTFEPSTSQSLIEKPKDIMPNSYNIGDQVPSVEISQLPYERPNSSNTSSSTAIDVQINDTKSKTNLNENNTTTHFVMNPPMQPVTSLDQQDATQSLLTETTVITPNTTQNTNTKRRFVPPTKSNKKQKKTKTVTAKIKTDTYCNKVKLTAKNNKKVSFADQKVEKITECKSVTNNSFQSVAEKTADCNVKSNTHKPIPHENNSINNSNENNVKDDLKWIENIKYVREIEDDEFIKTNTNSHDNFWENITYAGISNEDFM